MFYHGKDSLRVCEIKVTFCYRNMVSYQLSSVTHIIFGAQKLQRGLSYHSCLKGVRSASVHDLDINAAMKSRNGRSKGRGKEGGESDEETKMGLEKNRKWPLSLERVAEPRRGQKVFIT